MGVPNIARTTVHFCNRQSGSPIMITVHYLSHDRKQPSLQFIFQLTNITQLKGYSVHLFQLQYYSLVIVTSCLIILIQMGLGLMVCRAITDPGQ